jgi:retron-type reverse transcriptase
MSNEDMLSEEESLDQFQNNVPINRTKNERKATIILGKLINGKLTSPLSAMERRNRDTTHVNHKVYHLLCNPSTYINASARISKNKGALTKGPPDDEEMMRFFGQEEAIRIATLFKKRKFRFAGVRRTMIPKPGRPGKMRPVSPIRGRRPCPIDTPSQRDRIVQEAVRGILESVFEPEFREFDVKTKGHFSNFGFRPQKSTWDAVESFKRYGQRCNYVIEGDIVGAYNAIDHDILLGLIGRRIPDKAFLLTLKDLLRSSVVERDGKVTNSLLGTPQGGIASPILFNIYMFQFDKWMHKYAQLHLTEMSEPVRSPVVQNIRYEIKKCQSLLKGLPKGHPEVTILKKTIKQLVHERLVTPSYKVESLPKTPVFVRYADDWIFGFTGSQKEADLLKRRITWFLWIHLRMKLDPQKTSISHLVKDGFKFLGFELCMYKPSPPRKVVQKNAHGASRVLQRTLSRKINIRPDKDRILNRLKYMGVCDHTGFPIGKRPWAQLEEFRIVERYKFMMNGLADYYRNVPNPYVLNQVSYILQYSCAKTIATRRKDTMSQVFKKFGKQLKQDHTVIKADGTKVTKSVYFETYVDLKNCGFMSRKVAHPERPLDPFSVNVMTEPRCGLCEYA